MHRLVSAVLGGDAGGLTRLGVALCQQLGAGDPLPPAATGYGVQLVRSVAAFAGVCLAAWWVLRWAARRGMGQSLRGRDVRVRERVVLDARRSLYLVEVGSRVLLLGASDQSLTLLADVAPETLGAEADARRGAAPSILAATGPGARFAEVLARISGRAAPDAGPTDAAGPDRPRTDDGGRG